MESSVFDSTSDCEEVVVEDEGAAVVDCSGMLLVVLELSSEVVVRDGALVDDWGPSLLVVTETLVSDGWGCTEDDSSGIEDDEVS